MDVIVARYAAFLARRLKLSSVKQYLNIIRLLHLECNLDNLCADLWYLKTTIKGIEKVKGTEVIQKLLMMPGLLFQIKEKLKFHVLLRKSNLFGTDSGGLHPDRQLIRDCFHVSGDQRSVTVHAKLSKPNQTRERVLNIYICLPLLVDHLLCPVTAVLTNFHALGPAAPGAHAGLSHGGKIENSIVN